MRRVMEAAYAKVNLTLTVTGRRADGYHTIESLFQSVSLCDKLTLEQRERGFWLNETAGIPAEENIITRADRLLRREFPNLGGVAVTLEKNIPTRRDWAAVAPTRRPTCAGWTGCTGWAWAVKGCGRWRRSWVPMCRSALTVGRRQRPGSGRD